MREIEFNYEGIIKDKRRDNDNNDKG